MASETEPLWGVVREVRVNGEVRRGWLGYCGEPLLYATRQEAEAKVRALTPPRRANFSARVRFYIQRYKGS